MCKVESSFGIESVYHATNSRFIDLEIE